MLEYGNSNFPQIYIQVLYVIFALNIKACKILLPKKRNLKKSSQVLRQRKYAKIIAHFKENNLKGIFILMSYKVSPQS